MTVTVAPPPVQLQGAAAVGAGASIVMLMGPPVPVTASQTIAKAGVYTLDAPGLTIALDPAAQCVWIKDRIGGSVVSSSVDGATEPTPFLAAGDAMTLFYRTDLATWLKF